MKKLTKARSENIRTSYRLIWSALVALIIASVVIYLLVVRRESGFIKHKKFTETARYIGKVYYNIRQRLNHYSSLVWLDRTGSVKYSNYGDGTCPVNKDREKYKFLMGKWLEIAEKYDIEYFLSFGSLLGAWRDEEVVPWDGDVDVHMKVDDSIHIANLADTKDFDIDDGIFHIYATKDWRKPYRMRRRFKCNGTQVDSYSGQCSFTDPFARLIRFGYHLDIFVYTTFYDTLKYLPGNGNDEFLTSDIFPLTRCMYMGMEFRCPRNARAVLDVMYNRKLLPTDRCLNGNFQRNELAYMSPEEVEKIREETNLDEITFMSTEEFKSYKNRYRPSTS